jgi:hypothetical protein
LSLPDTKRAATRTPLLYIHLSCHMSFTRAHLSTPREAAHQRSYHLSTTKRSFPPKELINKHRAPHSFFISEKYFLCQGCNINCEVLLFTLFCENLDWSLAINTITMYYTGPTSVLRCETLFSWLGSTNPARCKNGGLTSGDSSQDS